MKQRVRRLFEIGYLKTLKMNYHYCGIRGVLHPRILVSKNVKIHKMEGSVSVLSTRIGAVHLGFRVVGTADPAKERFVWDNAGSIVFRGECFLGSGVRISNKGEIVFGDKLFVSANSDFVCAKKIQIGDHSTISWDCLVMDTDFHHIFVKDDENQIQENENPIIIGNHVWVGCRSSVMKGAKIPDHCIIASDSKVTKELEMSYSLYGGNRVLKQNVDWK